jgi:hypothetical protein
VARSAFRSSWKRETPSLPMATSSPSIIASTSRRSSAFATSREDSLMILPFAGYRARPCRAGFPAPCGSRQSLKIPGSLRHHGRAHFEAGV